MIRTRLVAVSLAAALLLTSSARAQEPSDAWHTFAERLAPGSFVVVQLSDGGHVQGHLVGVTADTMRVLPKTRLPVPVREVAFSRVKSMDLRVEGMSPGAKVLIGAGAAFGAMALIAVAVLAGVK